VRVLADTHALYWYLISPGRLSPSSLEVLGQAEDSDGIAVSALTIPELWLSVSRKRGDRAIPRSGYALLDPETALDVVPLDTSAWRHFSKLCRLPSATPPTVSSSPPLRLLASHS